MQAGQWGLWLEDDDEEDWDEEDEEEDWGEEEEREEGERDFCGLLDDRSEDRERCERVVRDLDGLHERIRGTVRQSEDADERRSLIREGLGEGRRLVEDETRSHPDRDVSREEEERRP